MELGSQLERIQTPSAIVLYERLQENIRRYAISAKTRGVSLRPHIKTHRCAEIAKMQASCGANGFTVATLEEAEYFAKNGFDNLTYAVPIEPNKLEDIFAICRNRTEINLLLDSLEAANFLIDFCKKTGWKPPTFLKINCGNNRVGLDPNESHSLELAAQIAGAKGYRFEGLLAHAGHSYTAKNIYELKAIAVQERDITCRFADSLRKRLNVRKVSIGSTPTFSTGIALEGVDEARPGNYVFYDYHQVTLGSCSESDVSFFIAASVISHSGNRTIVDAGATSLSKDAGPTHIEPNCGFGRVYSPEMELIGKVVSLTQEHGVLQISKKPLPPIGSRLLIMPNHSCLAAYNFDEYYVFSEGYGEVWSKI